MPVIDVLQLRMKLFLEEMDRQGIDAAYITDPGLRRYLVDEESTQRGYACLLIHQDGSFIHVVGNGKVSGLASKLGGAIRTFVDYDMNQWAKPLRNYTSLVIEVLLDWNPRTLGVDGFPMFLNPSFAEFLSGRVILDVRSYFEQQRLTKASYEIERIRAGGLVNAAAYRAIRENAAEGMSEYDLFATMTAGAMRAAQREVNFINKSDLVSGERTMAAGGPPSSRVLQTADTIIADLFPTVDGYHADNCRSFVVGGKPSPLQTKIRDVVLQALLKAELLLRPGVRANEVFHEVNEVLRTIGNGYSIIHHVGHGVGVEDQERPYLVPGSDEVLQEGMVISVEPGIYVEGVGIRIENVYLVTADGTENLTPIPDEL